MNYERAKLYLEERGQQHLLQYYGELTEDERLVLLDDIENTNFSIIKNLNQSQKKLGKITPINAVSSEEIKRRRLQFESVGLNFLAEGKVAAVLLAGGQGSRLGYNGPKGTFNIGVTRELSIFELQMDNIKEVVSKTGRYFHLFIMTSRSNNDETVAFYEKNNFFGYPRDMVHFYIQDAAPTCDYNGRVFLDRKTGFRWLRTETEAGILRLSTADSDVLWKGTTLNG